MYVNVCTNIAQAITASKNLHGFRCSNEVNITSFTSKLPVDKVMPFQHVSYSYWLHLKSHTFLSREGLFRDFCSQIPLTAAGVEISVDLRPLVILYYAMRHNTCRISQESPLLSCSYRKWWRSPTSSPPQDTPLSLDASDQPHSKKWKQKSVIPSDDQSYIPEK